MPDGQNTGRGCHEVFDIPFVAVCAVTDFVRALDEFAEDVRFTDLLNPMGVTSRSGDTTGHTDDVVNAD